PALHVLVAYCAPGSSTASVSPPSLRGALPILGDGLAAREDRRRGRAGGVEPAVGHRERDEQTDRVGEPRGRGEQRAAPEREHDRSEEHTSELQSREKLVCRLLLEKKKERERGR